MSKARKPASATKHSKKHHNKRTAKHLRFAEVWNNPQIRIRHELQSAIQTLTGKESLPSWKEVWKMRGRYKAYQLRSSKNVHKPPLIVREYDTGEPKELHHFVEDHLDEFKYDRKRIKRAVKHCRGFVVGNYQWGAMPAPVIETAKRYAKHRGFELIIGLSQYGRIEMDRDSDELLSVLPEEVRGHIVVDNVTIADYVLNCNTHLVQTSDTYLADSVCEIAGEQSTIFLGNKQEMRHWMRLEDEYPACYMTSGSLHHPSHKRTRMGKNNKAVAVARHRHEYGFVVLEIVKDKEHGTFAIPRQLRATPEGLLYDIDVKHGGARRYTPEGHEHRPDGVDTLKAGDVHEAGLDPEIWSATFEQKKSVAAVLGPKHVHVGDTFDNKWGNPFRHKQTVRSSYLARHNFNDIRNELEATVSRLTLLQQLLRAGTTITHEPSNHSDDWMRGWINRGDLQEDPLNSPLLCELWLAVYRRLEQEGRSIKDKDAVEEKSPFGLYITQRLPDIQCPSYQELAEVMRPVPGPDVIRRIFMHHGHIGPKGMETRSIRAFAAFNKKSAGGHVHSAARHNGHDQVGVMTKRLKHYVHGPKTNWTNSHLVVFENGETAHIFIIWGHWYGTYRSKDEKRGSKKKKAK